MIRNYITCRNGRIMEQLILHESEWIKSYFYRGKAYTPLMIEPSQQTFVYMIQSDVVQIFIFPSKRGNLDSWYDLSINKNSWFEMTIVQKGKSHKNQYTQYKGLAISQYYAL